MRRMGPKRRAWERHVQEALDVARPTPEPLPPLPVREKATEPLSEGTMAACVACEETVVWSAEDGWLHREGAICVFLIRANWHPSKGPRAGLYLVTDETEHERAEDA